MIEMKNSSNKKVKDVQQYLSQLEQITEETSQTSSLKFKRDSLIQNATIMMDNKNCIVTESNLNPKIAGTISERTTRNHIENLGSQESPRNSHLLQQNTDKQSNFVEIKSSIIQKAEFKNKLYQSFQSFENIFIDNSIFQQKNQNFSFLSSCLKNFKWGAFLIYPHERQQAFISLKRNIFIVIKIIQSQILLYLLSLILTIYMFWYFQQIDLFKKMIMSLYKFKLDNEFIGSAIRGVQLSLIISIIRQFLNWVVCISHNQSFITVLERIVILMVIFAGLEGEAMFLKNFFNESIDQCQNMQIYQLNVNLTTIETKQDYQSNLKQKVIMTALIILISYQGWILSKNMTFYNFLDQTKFEKGDSAIHPPVLIDIAITFYSIVRLNICSIQELIQLNSMQLTLDYLIIMIAFIALYFYNKGLKINENKRKNYIRQGQRICRSSSAFTVIQRQTELSSMHQIWLKSLKMLPESQGAIIISLPSNFYSIQQEMKVEWINSQFLNLLDQQFFNQNEDISLILDKIMIQKVSGKNQNSIYQEENRLIQQISILKVIQQILKKAVLERQIYNFQQIKLDEVNYNLQNGVKFIQFIHVQAIDHIENSLINSNYILPELLNQQQYYLIMVSDVSDQQIIANLKSQNLKAIQSLAEDFRGPINQQRFNHQLVKTALQKQDANELEKIINKQDNQLSFIDRVVKNSEDFINLEMLSLQYQETDIQKSIQKVFEIMSEQSLLKGIKIEMKIDENVPQMIKIDRQRVERVLMNLIDNFMRFTQTGNIIFKVTAHLKDYQNDQQMQPLFKENSKRKLKEKIQFFEIKFQIQDAIYKENQQINQNLSSGNLLLNTNEIELSMKVSKGIIEKMEGIFKIEQAGNELYYLFSLTAEAVHVNQSIQSYESDKNSIQQYKNQEQLENFEIHFNQISEIRKSMSYFSLRKSKEQKIKKYNDGNSPNDDIFQNKHMIQKQQLASLEKEDDQQQIINQEQINEQILIQQNLTISQEINASLNDTNQQQNTILNYFSFTEECQPKFIDSINRRKEIEESNKKMGEQYIQKQKSSLQVQNNNEVKYQDNHYDLPLESPQMKNDLNQNINPSLSISQNQLIKQNSHNVFQQNLEYINFLHNDSQQNGKMIFKNYQFEKTVAPGTPNFESNQSPKEV